MPKNALLLVPILLWAQAVGAAPDPATVYAWFQADTGVITNASGTITNWQNQAAMGTPSTRNLNMVMGAPTLAASDGTSGTNPVVRFPGTTSALIATNTAFGTITNSRTLIFHCRVRSVPGSGGFLFDGANAIGMNRAQIYTPSTPKWEVGIQPPPVSNAGNADTQTLAWQTNVWQSQLFSFSPVTGGTRVTHFINGVGSFSYTNSLGTNGLAGLRLGLNAAGSYPLPVDIAELLVYDRILGTNEQQSVLDYLAGKWAPPTPTLQSGAYAWFKADAGAVTNASGSVTNWQNQAVTGAPYTRNLNLYGTPPVLTPGAAGTNPVVRFAGANNIFAAAGNFGAISSNRTIVACCKLVGTNDGFLFDGSTSSGMTRAQVRSGSWQTGIQPAPIGNAANADPVTLAAMPDTWQAHFFNFEPVAGGTRVTHSLFDGASITYTNANTNALGGIILGANTSQAMSLAVDIGELFVYDRSLTTNEQLSLGAYLAGRWPLTTLPPPAITGLNPASGSSLGGTAVAISGTNFLPGLTVRFRGAAAPSVSYSNASLVTVVTPAGAAGPADVELRNPDNQLVVLTNGFTFVAAPAPTVTGISPASGSTVGGTVVSLSGTNFAAGLAVRFGGTPATSVVFSNSTMSAATTPASVAGVVDVTVINPDGQSNTLAQSFTYVAPAAPPPNATNVYAWYKGDSGIIAWSPVSNWPNQSASTTTPASRDLSRISGTPVAVGVVTPTGTLPVVRYDGTDATWATSANFGSITTNRTVVAYCRLTSTSGGFLFDGSTTSGQTRAQVRGGYWQVGLQPNGSGANADTNTFPATNGVWLTHFFAFDNISGATRVTHTIAGVGSFTYTNSQTVGLGGLIVGQNVSASLGLPVDVAEFIVYNRSLDAGEQQSVTDYLSAKWGQAVDATAPPMSYVSCTAAQSSRTVPNFGLHHVLDAQITTSGQGNPIALTNITFTLAGSTDVAADVATVSVWFTGVTNLFRPIIPFATYTGPLTGTLSLSGNQPLSSGVNHIWIAVEPKPRAPWGHLLDAELVSLGITGPDGGDKTPAAAAPAQFLTLGNAPFYNYIRRKGDDGVFEFRIPGLVATTNGTLIAVFDERWDGNNDLPGNLDVGCLRSTDLGNTWGPMITVMDYDKTVPNSSGNGVGDPAILVDRQTGTIWVAALWSFGNHGYTGSGAGLSTNQTGQYVLARSDDDGLTWSEPINITAQAKVNTSWGVCFQGPGNGIQLRDGTLVFPSQHTQPGGGSAKAFFIYSADHGATWKASPDVTTNSSPQMNENQMVELNSGQIMVSSRLPSGGGGFRGWSTYTPGLSLSNGTWSALVTNLPDPICQGSFIRYSSKLDGAPRNRLLFSNPNSSSTRVNQIIRMSEDEGQTWTVSRQIDTLAGYSCLAALPDGTIGLFYEDTSNSYLSMIFARVSMDWLTKADVDTDGDGMSDYYEGINGLSPNDPGDANLDRDGDGMSNLQEYLAGTMANDPQSMLRVTSATVTGGNMTVTWPSVVGVYYCVQQADQLAPATWSTVPGAANIQATSSETSFALPLGATTNRFFRVQALASH